EQYGTLTIYDRTPVADVVERCKDAAIVLTNKVPFDRNAISNLPKLKLICVTATGYNIIDTAAAREGGIAVCNVPAYGTASVAQFAAMKTVFAESDIVSLHCPLKPDNHQFVNQSFLQLMKPSAFLINTARGQLINEQDLADALNNGVIAGAGLDVLSAEPPSS